MTQRRLITSLNPDTLAHGILAGRGLPAYTCNGNNANQIPTFNMNTIDKHTVLIKDLAEKTTLLQQAERISIEQKHKPWFRTFIACGFAMSKEEVRKVEDVAEALTLHCNPHYAGGKLSSISFTDMDEKQPEYR